jgi:hypothetical protein
VALCTLVLGEEEGTDGVVTVDDVTDPSRSE